MVVTLSTEWGDERSGGDSASDQKWGKNGRQLATSTLNPTDYYHYCLNAYKIDSRSESGRIQNVQFDQLIENNVSRITLKSH